MSLSKKSTFHFIETIRMVFGQAQLLHLHQQRLEHTFACFYPGSTPHDLHLILASEAYREYACVKCRVEYGRNVARVHYQPYRNQVIDELVVIENDISYPFKFKDRSKLEELKDAVGIGQEPLICTNGRIRETTYGNVLMRIDGKWKTPLYPLFHGVMRAHLLNEGLVVAEDLFIVDYQKSEQTKIINAMMPFETCITLSNQ
jgi:4-amino-4-deoxychorismate lyase